MSEEEKEVKNVPQPDDKAEEKTEEEKNTEPVTDEAEASDKSEADAEEKTAPPEMSEIDKLKEENFRLKVLVEANAVGFEPAVIEDAVILAEAIVKKDGSDISAALKAVAKKYPAWTAKAKDENQKGGFKLGADSSKGNENNDEKLNKIFGIKKK